MLQTILEHRTIRKYKATAIPQNILDNILLAATRGSNTGNMQAYSIIITQDEKMKKEMLAIHFNQQMVVQAPLILSFCVDYNRFNKWCSCRNTSGTNENFLSFFNASIDAVIATQNACIAAESFGLGICYLGTTTYNADKMIKLLELPKGVVPITSITIGYPNEDIELTERLPISAIVHYEKYKDYTTENINTLYYEKENNIINKQFVENNLKENLAQVFTEIRYPKTTNEEFSKILLDVLKSNNYL